MHLRKRVLVTGGAGFLGSHLCERLLQEGCDVICCDNFYTGSKRNIAHLLEQPLLRAHPPRHHLPALPRGGRDLQPGLPGLADPLPERPRPDHQGERPRRHQHAGAGQAGAGADPAGLHLRGLRRPVRAPPDRGLLGQRQPHRPALLLRRGQALRRDAVLRLPPPAPAGRSGSCASSTPTARACTPNDGRVVSNFIVQALTGRDITVYGDGGADPLLLLRGRPDRGHVPA